MGCPSRAGKDQIDPVMTAMAIAPQEDRLVPQDGMAYLLDEIRRAGTIIAERALEQASFVAAARMSRVEHMSLRSSITAWRAFFRTGMAVQGPQDQAS
jgi:hypothetical protein